MIEVDASGLLVATVLFDLDDGRSARREAWARWAALEPAVAPYVAFVAESGEAFDGRDRDRLRVLLADDLVVEDHRRTGMGRIVGGRAYVDSLAVLWDLTSVTRVELGWFWPAFARHGMLYTIRRTGDVSGGGPFESDYLMLVALAAEGRATRIELFDLEALDAALARFEALCPDRPFVPPTPETR